MEHDIPFGISNQENGTTFLDFPLFLGVFQWDEPTKRVPFTAEPEIPEILTKWKAPTETNKVDRNAPITSKDVFPKRSAKRIDGTEKPKIPLNFVKRAARYKEFGYK